ncbi:unnamed protein product [Symbiodinium microadriaticum]|nr:unnamed protein product [Symbiodinium sp. KB8]CAE7906358.1 unnamed protein product [Symbiodinium microadriaticum]
MSGCIGYQNWEFWRTVGTFTRVLSRAVCAHKFWSILGRLVPEAEIQTNEDGSVSSFRDRFLSGDVSIATSVAEPRSPYAAPVDTTEGPSGLLISAMQQTPKQLIQEPANKDDLAADFKPHNRSLPLQGSLRKDQVLFLQALTFRETTQF